MRINIMGATGQLGGKVTQALLEQGAAEGNLIASIRTPVKAKKLEEQGVKAI